MVNVGHGHGTTTIVHFLPIMKELPIVMEPNIQLLRPIHVSYINKQKEMYKQWIQRQKEGLK